MRIADCRHWLGRIAAGIVAVACVLGVTASPVRAVDFEKYPEAADLVKRIAQDYQLKERWVEAVVLDAVFQDEIIESITRPAEKRLPWYRYKPIFIQDRGIELGVAFWNRHAETLERAQETYGVDAAIIVAIIGVETRYGRITGRHRVIDSLITIALGYPRRSEFFTREFGEFLRLCDEEGLNPLNVKGSYAGAMGIPQFISSSYRNFAVDFNGNGQRNLLAETDDAIGSVANYLKRNGWVRNGPVYAEINSTDHTAIDGFASNDLKPKHTYGDLRAADIELDHPLQPDPDQKIGVIKFEVAPDEFIFRASFPNFYAITTYNRSTLYAMAVAELARRLAAQRGGG